MISPLFQKLLGSRPADQMGLIQVSSKRAVLAAVAAEVGDGQKNIFAVSYPLHLSAKLHQLQDIPPRAVLRRLAHHLYNGALFSILQPDGMAYIVHAAIIVIAFHGLKY